MCIRDSFSEGGERSQPVSRRNVLLEVRVYVSDVLERAARGLHPGPVHPVVAVSYTHLLVLQNKRANDILGEA